MNPYESPRAAADAPQRTDPARRRRRALARWTLICTASAAPSFFWGCALHNEPQHLAGMIAGILVFVFVYTGLECSALYERLVRMRYVRSTLMIGYGTRLAISILFPVGLTIDIFTGMLAVSLVQGEMYDLRMSGQSATFLAVFFTTVLQGFFLNVILAAYMLLILALRWGVRGLWNIKDRPGGTPAESPASVSASC